MAHVLPEDRPAALARVLTTRFESPVPLIAASSPAGVATGAAGVAGAPAVVLRLDTRDLGDARRWVEDAGLEVDLFGRVGDGDDRALVVARERLPETAAVVVPRGFRVLAVVPVYNEADVVAPCVERLVAEGVEVHVIDNWSTDGTRDRIEHLVGNGVVAVERFPADAAPTRYLWRALLRRVEEVAAASGADWCILHDADERRSPPWPDRTLRDGLFEVSRRGFNAVNHTIVEFHPVDDGFVPGTDYEAYLRYWSPPRIAANRVQLKAWSAPGGRVDLHGSGGHEARFPGRRVFPYNFLLKHYPVRSQRHGEQKVFTDRKPRWDPEERKQQWHRHYDHVRPGHNFLKDPAALRLFGDGAPADLLFERITGEGALADDHDPGRARARLVSALQAAGLRNAAVAVRRWYRIARRRDIETGQR